jgi:hypothetical protein
MEAPASIINNGEVPRIINIPVNEMLVLLLTTVIGIIYSINVGGKGALGPSFSGTILALLIITFAVGNIYLRGSQVKDPAIYFTMIVVGSVAVVGVALMIFSILFQRSIDTDKKSAYFTPNAIFATVGGGLFLFGVVATVFINIYGSQSTTWLYFVDWYTYLATLGIGSAVLLSAIMTSY